MRIGEGGRVATVSLFEDDDEEELASLGERVETEALIMPSIPPPPPLPVMAVTIETAFLPRTRSRANAAMSHLLGVLLGIVVLTPATALACALAFVLFFR